MTRRGLALVAIVAGAAALRFWRLDARPLSPDEMLTVLIAIGRSYTDIPIGEVWPLARLPEILTPVYGRSWADIWRTLADPGMHHAHPPLFYWLVYEWVEWSRPTSATLVTSARTLSAVFGAAGVAAMYGLTRSVFSTRAGVMAALLMAISPLALEMSQDARNYTLPLVFVIAALWVWVSIVRRLAASREPTIAQWAAWCAANTLSCYSHYFSILAVAGQSAALLWLMRSGHLPGRDANRRAILQLAGGLALVALLCLPMASTLHGDYSRLTLAQSDNDWWKPRSGLEPLGEAVAGWLTMIGPVPNAATNGWLRAAIVVVDAAAIVALIALASSIVRRARRRAWPPEAIALAVFAAIVCAELLAIVYVFQRDVFRYPRYHFAYFPAALALLAGGLAGEGRDARAPSTLVRAAGVTLLVSAAAGCWLVTRGYGFQDAYYSRRIAANIASVDGPALTVMGGDSFLTTSIGLSIAREIEQRQSRAGAAPGVFAYVPHDARPDGVWPGPLTSAGERPRALWLVHPPPGRGYPGEVEIRSSETAARATCRRASEPPRYAGFEHQRYTCAEPR
jgi:uncharacterized membrane protein